MSHHRQFHFVRVIDSRLIWINILLLISIVFIPFSTDVAGDYPEILVAVLLFHINVIIIGLIFSYHAYHILQSKNLCDPNFDRKFLQVQFHRSVLIPIIAFMAVIIAFVNSSLSLLVYLFIPVATFFLQRADYS